MKTQAGSVVRLHQRHLTCFRVSLSEELTRLVSPTLRTRNPSSWRSQRSHQLSQLLKQQGQQSQAGLQRLHVEPKWAAPKDWLLAFQTLARPTLPKGAASLPPLTPAEILAYTHKAPSISQNTPSQGSPRLGDQHRRGLPNKDCWEQPLSYFSGSWEKT